MGEIYCSSCQKEHDEWKLIDCYSECIDATMLEHEVIECRICNTRYNIITNDEEAE